MTMMMTTMTMTMTMMMLKEALMNPLFLQHFVAYF